MSYYRDGAVDPQFARLMVTLAEALGTKLTEARIRIYARLLSDIPYDQLRGAFTRCANEDEFFPTPGRLRRFVAPTEDDAALVAWSALGRAAEEAGAYTSVEVEDGAAAEALLAVFGSWQAYCETDDGPGLALKRQEFLAHYRQAVRDGARRTARRLPGMCEVSGQYPATAELASRVWVARIGTGGTVAVRRDAQAALTEGEHGRRERIALPEGGVAEDGEGAGRPAGDAGEAGGPGDGGGS